MKTKLLRFAIMSVGMTVMIFLVFTLFDGTAKETVRENLRLSILVGVLTSLILVFFSKFYTNSKS